MKDIVVVGAGKIGSTIARLLADSGDYRLTVVDRAPEQLRLIETSRRVRTQVMEITEKALAPVLEASYAVLSAAPYQLTTVIAKAAARAQVHYLDLTEDVRSTRAIRTIAKKARSAFLPQCGLAPGFVSIVAYDLASRFDTLESVRMRVGALPQYPSNALNYNLTWSTDGVINEYIEPCEAIVDGHFMEVPALEEREEFSLDGVTYEAFNTSGGLGTLAETLKGKVNTLNYRTIRYPGHVAIMKALLNDLGLRHRRDLLKDILENALPATMQDVVIIFVTVSGRREGRLIQETYANKIYSRKVKGKVHSAIQMTTAGSICAVLDLLREGTLPQKGFIHQEDIRLSDFLANRFGKLFVNHVAGLDPAIQSEVEANSIRHPR